MNWLRELFKSSYTRELEGELARERAEVGRLRGENRGLVNSLLGTVGLPPMTEQEKVAVPPSRRRSLHQIQASTERESVQQMRTREALLKGAGKAPEPPAA